MDSWNEIISRCLRMLNIEEFKGAKLIRFSQLPPGPRRPPCSCAFLSSSRPDRRAGISKGASEALPCVRLEVLVLGGHFRRISDMLIPLAECRAAPPCAPCPGGAAARKSGPAPFYGPPPVLPCHIGGKAFL